MIELNVICDKCGEVISTKRVTNDFKDFLENTFYEYADPITGERIRNSFFRPSIKVGNKHLHYCGNCKDEIYKLLGVD